MRFQEFGFSFRFSPLQFPVPPRCGAGARRPPLGAGASAIEPGLRDNTVSTSELSFSDVTSARNPIRVHWSTIGSRATALCLTCFSTARKSWARSSTPDSRASTITDEPPSAARSSANASSCSATASACRAAFIELQADSELSSARFFSLGRLFSFGRLFSAGRLFSPAKVDFSAAKTDGGTARIGTNNASIAARIRRAAKKQGAGHSAGSEDFRSASVPDTVRRRRSRCSSTRSNSGTPPSVRTA